MLRCNLSHWCKIYLQCLQHPFCEYCVQIFLQCGWTQSQVWVFTCGIGLVHDLRCNIVPPPQVTLTMTPSELGLMHGVETVDHGDHPPSIVMTRTGAEANFINHANCYKKAWPFQIGFQIFMFNKLVLLFCTSIKCGWNWDLVLQKVLGNLQRQKIREGECWKN
jgi:hypothetical protein